MVVVMNCSGYIYTGSFQIIEASQLSPFALFQEKIRRLRGVIFNELFECCIFYPFSILLELCRMHEHRCDMDFPFDN